jgi:GntR family transcriptional repressor for pyruvate dehydrogenase complex
MDTKVRALGIKPHIEEHTAILQALKQRDPDAARAAMHDHLTRVMEETFAVTETEALAKSAVRPTARRKRYESSAPRSRFVLNTKQQ